jgi:hypothetical protein
MVDHLLRVASGAWDKGQRAWGMAHGAWRMTLGALVVSCGFSTLVLLGEGLFAGVGRWVGLRMGAGGWVRGWVLGWVCKWVVARGVVCAERWRVRSGRRRLPRILQFLGLLRSRLRSVACYWRRNSHSQAFLHLASAHWASGKRRRNNNQHRRTA